MALKAPLPKATSLIADSWGSLPTLGQADDLMSVDSEDHLLLIRQLDDEFQLLAGPMHQLDSHIALDLGNYHILDKFTAHGRSITVMALSPSAQDVLNAL